MLSHYHRTRLLLLAGISACSAIFYFASRAFSIPLAPGFDGSLFNSSSPALSFLVIAIALAAALLVGTLIARTVRLDAGLFCAVVGLSVLSMRSGTMGQVLRESASSSSAGIFIGFAVELALLYAIVVLAWFILWQLHRRGFVREDQLRDGIEDRDGPLSLKLSALAIQAGVMALCMFFLMQSDAKMQALVGVGLCAFIGSAAAYYVYPVSPSLWLWLGPAAVGIVGYILTSFNPQGWQTGQLTSPLAGLARALPIDYAAAGPAGAIIGYWLARRWFGTPEVAAKVPDAA